MMRYLCIGIIFKNGFELFYTNGISLVEMGVTLLCHKSTENLKRGFALPMLIYNYIAFFCMMGALIVYSPQQVAHEVSYGAISNSTTTITYNQIPVQDYILMYWCLYAIILFNVQTYIMSLDKHNKQLNLEEPRLAEGSGGVTKGGESFDAYCVAGTV